jgi:hypothetical protein
VPTGNNTANTNSRPRNNNGGVNSGGGGVVAPGVGGGGIARPADGGRTTRGRSNNTGDIVTPRDNVNGVANPGDNNTGREVTPSDIARPSDMPTRSTRGRQTRDAINSNPTTETPEINNAPRDVETPSRRNRRVEPGNYSFPDQPARVQESQQPVERPRGGRNTENYTPAPNRQEQPQEQPTRQQRTRETYQAPRQERTYEAPRQQQRTYEAPRQERTYEAPSRSTPSNDGGGSNSGGGRSSGGRPRN